MTELELRDRGSFLPIDAEDGRELEVKMQDLLLRGTVTPVGAKLRIRHSFVSAEKTPTEVVYTFALPRDAALRRFRVVGEGFSVRSRLEPVDEALEGYEDAIEEGHLASVARTHRDGYVSLTVGNVRPGETVTVLLELLCGVETTDESVRFRFPFTMAPCYHPDMRAGLIDDSTGEIELPEDEFGDLLLPPFKKDAEGLHRVNFDLGFEMPVPVVEVTSTSHLLAVRLDKGGPVRASLASASDLPNRDLVLDVRLKQPLEGTLWGEGEDGVRHFAAVVPSKRFGEAVRRNRRIVFLIDRSGSMNGLPMQAAKRAVLACLGALDEEDEIGVIAFNDSVTRLMKRVVPATNDVRKLLREEVHQIHSSGGTELLRAIREGVKLLGESGGELFLITDGQIFGTEDLVAAVSGLGVQVHCLGIGAASQDRFLEQLSRSTQGVSHSVAPREPVDTAALELFAESGTTVANGLEVAPVGNSDAEILPRPPRSVVDGRPMIVWGEVGRAETGSIEISWRGESGDNRFTLALDGGKEGLSSTIALLRGARLISDTEAAVGRLSEDSTAQLETLARRFGLANRAMALLAVVEREGDEAAETPRTRVLPVGLPENLELASYFPSPRLKMSGSWENIEGEFEVPVLLEDQFSVECAELEPPPAGFSLESSSTTLEQAAMEFGAELEGDGGMPGSTEAERILATLAASLVFAALVHRFSVKRWRAHLRRTLDFLLKIGRSALKPERRDVAVRALMMAKRGDFYFSLAHSSEMESLLGDLGELLSSREVGRPEEWEIDAWNTMQELWACTRSPKRG